MRYVIIENGVVTNVIQASETFVPASGGAIQSDTAQIGWTYANGEFTAVTLAPTFQTEGLSFLQFMGLFTSAEQSTVINSSDTKTKVFVMMAAGSGGLDLSNPEVVSGVNYLASIGLITTERATTILSGNPDWQ